MAKKRVRLLLLLVLLGLAVAAWFVFRRRADLDDPPPPPAQVKTATDTFALLVGCTDYPLLAAEMEADIYESVVKLRGPANDAALMHSVLRRYLGVPEENIRVLAGWPDDPAQRPTRANILDHLDQLAGKVPPGARVLFLFAGHGAQQPDKGTEEGDRQDEILLPADAGKWDPATSGAVNAITDDEIRARLLALRDAGATVWAMFDCCHSGTMMRGTLPASTDDREDVGEVRLRQLPAALLGIPTPLEAPPSRGTAAPVGAVFEECGESLRGVAAFYGAHSWEQAPEMVLPRSRGAHDRQVHGLLTFQVARALQRHGGGLTLAEIFQHVRSGYEALKWKDASPVTEGDLGLRVRPGAGGAVLLLRREAGRLVLDAGSLRGLTVGSVLEVFRPGAFGDPQARLGKLRLMEVELLRSLCGAMEGGPDPAAIPDAAPARLFEWVPGAPPLRLALLDESGAPLASDAQDRVCAQVFANARLRTRFPCVEAAHADWLLRALPAGSGGTASFVLSPARPDMHLEPLEATAQDLVSILERVQRAEFWRRLTRNGPLSPLPQGMVVEALLQRFGSEEREPLPARGAVAPGDTIWVRIVNGTEQDVDVVVRNLDSAQIESHVWPEGEPCRRLTKDEKDPEEVGVRLTDDGLGLESLIVVVAVRDRGAAPLDVGNLAGAALQDSLDGMKSRGDQHIPAASVAIHEITWTMSWGPMGIPTPLIRQMLPLEPALVASRDAAGGRPALGQSRWQHATIVHGDETRGDILLLSGEGEVQGEGAFAILVDADGDAGLATADPAEAARRAAAAQLPVELLLVLGPSRSWAAYPRTPGDLDLGLRLVGATAGHGRADQRLDLRGEAWEERETCAPWLSTSWVAFQEGRSAGRRKIVAALRGLLRTH